MSKRIGTWALLTATTLLMTACRANLGNFFDLY
jgi:hypothetical protein